MRQHQPSKGKYSPEVEEILHKQPSLLVRKGILFLAILVALLLVGTNFINYPEQLTTPIHFPDMPAMDTGRSYGEIVLNSTAASLVKTGQHVKMIVQATQGSAPIEIQGKVAMLSPLPEKDYYAVLVLPDVDKELNGYEGTAYIYIGEESLLSKILNPVFAVFKSAGH